MPKFSIIGGSPYTGYNGECIIIGFYVVGTAETFEEATELAKRKHDHCAGMIMVIDLASGQEVDFETDPDKFTKANKYQQPEDAEQESAWSEDVERFGGKLIRTIIPNELRGKRYKAVFTSNEDMMKYINSFPAKNIKWERDWIKGELILFFTIWAK